MISGCTTQRQRLNYVGGLDPTPNSNTVEESTEKLRKIQTALLKRANACEPAKGNGDTEDSGSADCAFPPNGDVKWRLVTGAGFDFVDEECEKYIDALFWYNRFRNTAQNQFALTGAATAAVMGIAEASANAIAITAAAFGFGAASFDNITGNFLFELEPSGIKTLVDRGKAQYRASVEQRFDEADNEERRIAIYNPPATMSLVRGYLSLCLPASIETQVNGAIAATDFKEDPSARRGLVPNLRRVDAATDLAVAEAKIHALQANEAIEVTPLPQKVIKNALTDIERLLSFEQGKHIQAALCVEPDGNFGKMDSETRKAIKLFQQTKGIQTPSGKLEKRGDVADLIVAESCRGQLKKYRNAYERFTYEDARSIIELQKSINTELKALLVGLPIEETDIFDDKTRSAIKKIQKAKGNPETGEVTLEFGKLIAD